MLNLKLKPAFLATVFLLQSFSSFATEQACLRAFDHRPLLKANLSASQVASLENQFKQVERKQKPVAKDDVLSLPPTVPRVLFDPALPGARTFKQIKELKIFEFNVLNLYIRSREFLNQNENPDKPQSQLTGVARIMTKADPDVMVLAEVDNLSSLEKFNQSFLSGKYRSLLLEGNDQRGIDIGFLIKKDVPFDIEMRSFSYLKEDDGSQNPIFSRDLPVLLFRASGDRKGQPFLAVLGTHYKSMRGSNSDPMGAEKRERQAAKTAEIISDLEKEFGKELPIVLTGDFNNDVHEGTEFKPLYQTGMSDSLTLTGQKPQPTHAYFQPDGTPDPKQIDSIMLNGAFQKTQSLEAAEVLTHLDEQGNPLPFPKTFEERETRPSDHVPTMIRVDFQKLIPEELRRR